MRLSTDERRALGIVVGLLLLASLARWIERPRPLLADLPELDIAALEEASRAAKPPPRTSRQTAGTAGRTGSAGTSGAGGDAGAAQVRPPPTSGGAGVETGRVDVNTADVHTLQRLPGIGPAVAARIAAERAAGPFTGLDDLQRRVRGIGPALAARLAEHVTLPAATSGVAAGPVQSDVRPPAEAVQAWPVAAADGGSSATAAGNTSVHVPARAPGATVGSAGVMALDLNRATAGELEKISGVGPILAARLIARRDSLGGFRDWSEVDGVPGVGPAMLGRLKGLAVLGR